MSLHLLIASTLGGFLQRLRGGAEKTLTGIKVGTQVTRIVFAFAFASMLAAMIGAAWPAMLAPFIFIGVATAGWGPFQGLGLPAPSPPEKSWMRWLPLRLGLPIGSLAHDAVGLMEAGLCFMTPSAAFLWYRVGAHSGLLCLVAGLLWPVAYGIPRVIPLPSIRGFAVGQAWGEVFSGALAMAALFIACKGGF